MEAQKEQRLHPRLECSGRSEVYFAPDAPPLHAAILDLSLGGALIELELPRATLRGTKLELAFSVNNLPFRLRGQVRAVRSATTLGLIFETVNDRVKRHLGDLIEELTEENAKRRANLLLTQKRKLASEVA